MAGDKHFEYETVHGFFEHEDEITGPQFRANTKPGLGLIGRTYSTDAEYDPEGRKTQWERFSYFLKQQNVAGGAKVFYKLVIAGRHGQGFHNLKSLEVGRHAWDDYWSHLDGDDKTTWADAELTQKGREQAEALKTFWQESVRDARMPTPEAYYTSPLRRCLETSKITYAGLELANDRPFKPVIKESLREVSGVHTCDRRSTRSWIAANYPEFELDPSLTEQDEYWRSDVRETDDEVDGRVRKTLDDVFSREDGCVVSLTAHSGWIRGLNRVTKHRDVWVAPGALVPFLIKAELK
ncbi:phosphoglycerate mutase-like protein [Xylariomycetidae sp. FL2044]|nr:phosphoglycerate mutase-like protein [Xylariomycetidae sp. FL2044]